MWHLVYWQAVGSLILKNSFLDLLLTCAKRSILVLKERNLKLDKEAMWGCFHTLRSSTTFKDSWISFVQQETGKIPSPIFFQEVTQHIFKVLVKRKFIIMNPMKFNSGNPPLTREEENSLHYVAGYICRRLLKQLESSTHKCKDDTILCFMELNGDETMKSGEQKIGQMLSIGEGYGM